MRSIRFLLSSIKELTEMTKLYKYIAESVIGAGMGVILVGGLLYYISRFHWIAGAVFAAILIATSIWLFNNVKSATQKHETIGVIGTLALGFFTTALVCAWISFTLYVNYPNLYLVPTNFSPGTFFNFYMYTFLDLLPGIKVMETLHLKFPIEYNNFTAGLPILLFKIIVVWLFFDAFKSWLKAKKGDVRRVRP